MPIQELIADKTYLFFSHTIEKQAHNRALLRSILEKNIRLIDYETLVWDAGNKLLASDVLLVLLERIMLLA
jgi:hypothetical protein